MISVDVAEQRVAVLEDDQVAEVYLERDESRSIAGNIYKGTVDNVLPGMEAAFVEIGLEKNGFLYVDEIVTPELEGRRHGRKIQDLLSRGEEILVQAVKDPMKSKGARLTTEISLPGRFVVYVPSGEDFGVEEAIRSTLSRRVDLPSGGYLVFDYAEAFTVIDVNTGRFVGSRSKTSAGRLEDTITKNNLEAVKEVVRQLRLRDIGGIIVIDFIDMANPKNREAVEEALKGELERDRTKTYVVEISPLGLVEMTRQNVSHGPREILTKRCPTCAGDGVVFSEVSAAVEIERRLRSLAASSRSAAFRVELNPHVATTLIGPGADRLRAIEERTRRRFFIETKDSAPPEHFEVLARGPLAKLRPESPVEEGQELDVKLVEVGLHDATAGGAGRGGAASPPRRRTATPLKASPKRPKNRW